MKRKGHYIDMVVIWLWPDNLSYGKYSMLCKNARKCSKIRNQAIVTARMNLE